jgi:hypothetical protein
MLRHPQENKMKARKVSVLFAGLSLVALQATAGELPFEQCPQTIDIQQTIKSPIEGGWKTAINGGSLSLEIIGVSFREFPVEQTGFNVPEEERSFSNRDTVHYYTVDGGVYWAVCRYLGGTLYLTKKIPENAERCEVTYHDQARSHDRATIKCFDTPRKAK